MTTGVPQGGSLSSALFDMGIAPSIRRAQLAHPTASIYLIADDNMVVGPHAEAIATVKTITLLLADVGLTLATTTDSKNVIYGLGTQYTDARRDPRIFTEYPLLMVFLSVVHLSTVMSI